METNTTATSLTLQQCAEETKQAKSTIWRALKSGRLSGTRDDAGQWRVEPSELWRAFPPATTGNGAAERGQRGNGNELQQVQQRAALAEQDAFHWKARFEDMTAQRDHWQQMSARLLAGPVTPPAPPATTWRQVWRWMRATS